MSKFSIDARTMSEVAFMDQTHDPDLSMRYHSLTMQPRIQDQWALKIKDSF
jgi:hypothetical protein